MVAATVVSVTVIVASGGAATPFVAAAAAEGIAAGAAGTIATVGGTAAGTAVAGATGTAVAAGAITGAASAGTFGGAAVGAAVSGTAALGTAGVGAGSATAATVGFLAGPVGWLCLGTDLVKNQDLTFDCWKPLLHDKSVEPSKGKLLRDVLLDSRIKNIKVTSEFSATFPKIQVRNIWDEEFDIVYVRLPSAEIAAHAVHL